MEDFRRISISLSTVHGCLFYGSRVVFPLRLQVPDFTSRTFWDAKNEAASSNSCLLAKDR